MPVVARVSKMKKPAEAGFFQKLFKY